MGAATSVNCCDLLFEQADWIRFVKPVELPVSTHSLLFAFCNVTMEPAPGRPPPLLDTLSVAALLVILPAALLIATANCAPLSELVVAGVV